MSTEIKISSLSCLEAITLLLPSFEIVEEKESLGRKLGGALFGTGLLAFYAAAYLEELFTESIPDFFRNPREYLQSRKRWKKLKAEDKEAERLTEQEKLESDIRIRNGLISRGLTSIEERCLYSLLDHTGYRLAEGVELAEHLNEPPFFVEGENISPDVKRVTSRTIRTDSKGRPLEIEIDRNNLVTLMEGQLFFSSSLIDNAILMDRAGTYNDGSSSYKRVSPTFYESATVALLDAIDKRTRGDKLLHFLDVTTVRKEGENFYLTRKEL